jgi:cytochrome P450
VDGFMEQGRADLVTAFAYPLPIRVICALLDIRQEESLKFYGPEINPRASAR